MSLIDGPRRQQQEQERLCQQKSAQQLQPQTPPQPTLTEPPPIPAANKEIVPKVRACLSTRIRSSLVLVILIVLMLGGAAWLAWKLLTTQTGKTDQEPEVALVSPPPEGPAVDPASVPTQPEPSRPKHPYSVAVATLQAARALTNQLTTDTTDLPDEPTTVMPESLPSPAEPPKAEPTKIVEPTKAEPPKAEPTKIVDEKSTLSRLALTWRTHRDTASTTWPAISIKGHIARGHTHMLILDNGQLLRQGERTPEGVLFMSAENDRVRLAFKDQVRDYQLKGSVFMLLPPE